MKKTIDSSRTVKYKNEMIVFYVEIDYDDDDVDLNNNTVEGMDVRIDEDIYSIFDYKNGGIFNHEMTEEVLDTIKSHMHEYDFIEDVLMYEADNREPNIHYP